MPVIWTTFKSLLSCCLREGKKLIFRLWEKTCLAWAFGFYLLVASLALALSLNLSLASSLILSPLSHYPHWLTLSLKIFSISWNHFIYDSNWGETEKFLCTKCAVTHNRFSECAVHTCQMELITTIFFP